MRVTANLNWIVFWIGVFIFLSVIVISSSRQTPKTEAPTAEENCVKQNGVPVYDTWSGRVKDCKLINK